MQRHLLLGALFTGTLLAGWALPQDTRSPSDMFLREAVRSAQEISSPRNRILALSQIASLQTQMGRRASAQDNLRPALQVYEAMPAEDRPLVAGFLSLQADLPTALRIVEKVDDPGWRDRCYERLLTRWIRDGDTAASDQILARFYDPAVRDRAVVAALEVCRGHCEPERMAALAAGLTSAAQKAEATAILQAEESRQSGVIDLQKAVQMAASIPADEAQRQSSTFLPNCVAEHSFLARDLALKRVVEMQLSAGDRDGARTTAAIITDFAVRAQAETLVLARFAKDGEFATAENILSGISTQGCRDYAVEMFVAEEWRAGRQASALRRVRGLADPAGRAFGLLGMALAAPKDASASATLSLLREAAVAANQMGDPGEKGSVLASIAQREADMGAAAESRAALRDLPPSSPDADKSAVVIPGAEALTSAGDTAAAMALLNGKTEEQRAVALRRMAARLASQQPVGKLLAWIRALPGPYERSMAFLGAAEGYEQAARVSR